MAPIKQRPISHGTVKIHCVLQIGYMNGLRQSIYPT